MSRFTSPYARRRSCTRWSLITVCIGAMLAQPALALPSDASAPQTPPPRAAAAPAAPALAPEGGPTPTHALAGDRADLFVQLLLLGYDEADALGAVRQLTDADIDVLTEHPDMLQRAGELPNLTAAWIIGGLIVAGIVALAVAGEGTLTIT